MGLDMYLYASVPAPKDSPLFKVIEEGLTDDQRKEMLAFEPDYPNYVPSAYLSGWTFGGREPDALYSALAMEMGITPTEESPSIHLYKAGEGYKIEPTIYYWRKANAIHRWFVEKAQNGVDECQHSLVHPELLLDLIEKCEEITLDHSKTGLLQTQGGFFFGSTEYDEWYFRDIEETAKGLKAAVEIAAPKASHFVYHSSW